MEATKNITHIAVVPSPGFSHLIPILEFSKRLVHLHPDFHVTCIIPSLGSPSTASIDYLNSLPSNNIHSFFLPPISISELPQQQSPAFQSKLAMTKSLPSLREILNSLMCSKTSPPLAALVADTLAYEALDIAKELNISSFLFALWSPALCSFHFQIPKLDETILGEYPDYPEPFVIPGFVPLHGRDFPEFCQHRSSEAYKMVVHRDKRLPSLDGIMLNSFIEMGEETAKVLANNKGSGHPPVYLVGPIISQTGLMNEKDRPECMTWLDKQPPRSVLYVSFGSGGTLSQEQLNELALGLELSGHKFLWVLRAPSSVANASYHSASSSNENPKEFLPKGFLEKTKDQGFIVPSWAPQIQILSHNSVGGFLSHCGWNSTLESVMHGVPLITWPLFAEQKLNAVILNDALKVAVRPKVNKKGIVEREEIKEVVKTLMESEEGKGIFKRITDLKEAAANAMKEDGSSTVTLSQVAHIWKNKGVLQ
ncbi:hypothetical protein QN277_024603 [Acacia crassicarpa]|uniref:Glycosyltransferase n=1 Tax=Acacia crassicarpa TaxID=499986 RepID=A0AAE1MN97_9FABA|nr:hypothetical protein QN277_024603 [Acacia crassicarpa]